jgi:hypothetical protein
MADLGRRGLGPLQVAALLVATIGLAAGTGLAWHHPVAPYAALTAFWLWSAVVAWRPGIWLFMVPATLPLLNFAPWTGWVVFEEFDLLLLGVIAGAYAHLAFVPVSRSGESVRISSHRMAFIGSAAIFGALGVASLINGWSVAGRVPFGWFQGYADPMNAWRVFKSLMHAALLWPLLRREMKRAAATAVQRLASGMLVGLAVVTLAVIWERAAYPGLWNFTSRYRTTALFWEMHVGGAAIDAYLALATPFVAWALWSARTPLRWLAAAALALLTGYACLTTFSRGVYVAVSASLVLLGLLLAGQRVGGAVRSTMLRALWVGVLVLSAATGLALEFDAGGYAGVGLVLLGSSLIFLVLERPMPFVRWRPAGALALTLALALEGVAVLGLGSYMRERLAAGDRDLGTRLEHWRNGLGLMHGPGDWILGIGLGRLPGAYARNVQGEDFSGEVQFVQPRPGQRSGSVRMSGPKTPVHPNGVMALTQRVALRPVLPYRVAFDARAGVNTDVYLHLCEMHLLYPRNCQAALVRLTPGDAQWRHLVVGLRGPLLDAGYGWTPRLGVFSVAVVNAGGGAEFDNFSLIAPDRREALTNRDFSEELAGWLPSAQGYYLPWHIDNLYLEVLIEHGLLAWLAFMLGMGCALWRLVCAGGRAVPIAPFLAASLIGALCVGAVSSVLDAPRVAFLLFVLTLFAAEVPCDGRPTDR